MAYFAWVRDHQAWTPGGLHPQIIWDEKMAEYVKSQGHLDVVASHPLSVEEIAGLQGLGEFPLTLDDLAKKYPAP
jgi:hypothetical protein